MPIQDNISSYQKTEIVDKLALEIPQRKIADQHDISQPRVSKINKEEKVAIQLRKKELQALAPNILEEFRFDCLTSTELAKHLYRPEEFNNNTALKTNQDIITHKNSLRNQKIKILENIGIFESQALINYNQYNQDNSKTVVIEPAVLNMFANHAKELVDNGDVVSIEPENGASTP